MRRHHWFVAIALSATVVAAAIVHGATPREFTTGEIDAIWTELWKTDDPKISEPKINRISEKEVSQRLIGKWTVLFGVIPDKVTIAIRTNHLVGVSGQKDGKDWKNDGEWRLISGKLVFFLEEDSIPNFVFRRGGRLYVFDPWAKTRMSELKREK